MPPDDSVGIGVLDAGVEGSTVSMVIWLEVMEAALTASAKADCWSSGRSVAKWLSWINGAHKVIVPIVCEPAANGTVKSFKSSFLSLHVMASNVVLVEMTFLHV